MIVVQAKKHAEEQAQQIGRPRGEHKVSLWRALWTGFGWPYISLGLLKLFSDALNFAGPNAPPRVIWLLDNSKYPFCTDCSRRRDQGPTVHVKPEMCK